MKKVFKITGIVLGIIVLLIIGGLTYIKAFLPNVGPAPEVTFVSTPEKIERGKYLANHVMICMDCHSERDWRYFSGPMKLDSLGRGGELFDRTMGFPGVIYSANITPAGIGDWTDGEIFRAITTGVRKNGKAIFPVMPHDNYGKIDREDIEAIVVYLRTLEPVETTVPESQYDFPMNFIINTIPQKANFTQRPDSSDKIAYGKYLVTSASCGHCHTPFQEGKFDDTKHLAGGREFQMPAGVVRSANLTPDRQTGIGAMDKETFMNLFRAYRDSAYAHRPVDITKDFCTIMPWPVYAGMKDHDLSAIYDYLQSLEPIPHKIAKFEPYSASK